MTSKQRESAAAKAARMATVEPAVVEPVGDEVVEARIPVRRSGAGGRSVRVSLDLVPELYEDLTAWNRDAAHRVGCTRITNAETLRALVRVLLDDAAVSDEVTRRLRK